MSLFKHRYKYSIPERLSPEEARTRRLTAMLEKERRFAEIPNFPQKLSTLRSQVQKEKRLSLAKALVDDDKQSRHKAALIAAAIKGFEEKDFSDPEKRKLYRALRAKQEGQKNVGNDRRRFHPEGRDRAASSVFGSPAVFSSGDVFRERPDRFMPDLGLASHWIRVFRNPVLALPCIQRSVRREVMFAKKKAGKGYRVRHRRTWLSGVPC